MGWERFLEAEKGAGLTPQLCPALIGPPPLPFPCPNCLGVWVLALGGGDSEDRSGEGAQAESRASCRSTKRSTVTFSLDPRPWCPRTWALQSKTRAPTLCARVRGGECPQPEGPQAEGRRLGLLGKSSRLRGQAWQGHGAAAAAAAPRLRPCCRLRAGLCAEPGDTAAVQEHPRVLPYQVEGEPPVSISWQRDGLALANDSGATLMPEGSLHLAALPSRWSLLSNAHEYHCVAQNRCGRLVSRRARVQPASLSRFHQHPESVEVERGGVARFQCLIQGVPEPSISWEHKGTALNTANHR
nr:peroxidasin-like protein [Chlorocebus sabaeus]